MNQPRLPACTGASTEHRARTRTHALIAAQLLLGLVVGAILLGLYARPAHAQQQVGGYVVQAGDTLSVIADRYGVTLEELAALNSISDPNLLRVGQVLLIPGATGEVPQDVMDTGVVLAQAGDTVGAIARRVGQEPALVAALNDVVETARTFPGQPVRVPLAALPSGEPLRFGAVTSLQGPSQVEQGRTARVVIETARPLSLQANWNGTPLPFAPLDVITRQVALLPVPALLEPASYPLTITYTTRAGAPVSRLLSVNVVDGGYDTQTISVPSDRTDLLAAENVRAEEAKVAAVLSVFTPDLVLRQPFVQPIGVENPTSSPFGTRRYYDSGPNSYWGYHAGQDFSAAAGVPALAPAAGIVVLAEPLTVRGNAVILDHGRGVFTGYWHLSEINVTPGQVVNAGDLLGLVGNTGLSTGAHLHWEMRIYGIAVDPLQFLNEAPFP